MDLPRNNFKKAIAEGRLQIGLWSSLCSNIVAELVADSGFDWILLDGEHSPNDVTTFVPQLMALKGSPSAPVVRPPWNEPVIIKRLLDIGFHNFLMPYVETADQAKNAVAATRYPPAGMRGVSVSHRSNMYGTAQGYFPGINDNIAVLLQIDSRQGFAAVDEIAAVEGVDGLFVGPSDLAAAFGHLGNANHPEVQNAIRHVFARAHAAGKASGILAPVEADARRYLEWGATFVAVGSDLGLLRAASQNLCDKFREAAPAALRAGVR